MKNLLLVALAVITLTGCATGSHVMVGEAREPISPEDVKLYLDPPAEYEPIAIVQAHSKSGLTQQQDTNRAITRMKKEAASLGANGVLVLSSTGRTGASGFLIAAPGTFIGGPVIQAHVEGQAIFVVREK